MPKTLILLLTAWLCSACGGSAESPSGDVDVQRQWGQCGVNVQCESGLECFGGCTFECGEKYVLQEDGSSSYGLDIPSVNRCFTAGGICRGLRGVEINVCTKPEPGDPCQPQERGAAALDCWHGITHPECGEVGPGGYRTGSDIVCYVDL